MSKAIVLPKEFVEDLRKVFEKHNWSGHPVGFVAHPATAALGLDPCGDPEPIICPGGGVPHKEPVLCADGTIVERNVC